MSDITIIETYIFSGKSFEVCDYMKNIQKFLVQVCTNAELFYLKNRISLCHKKYNINLNSILLLYISPGSSKAFSNYFIIWSATNINWNDFKNVQTVSVLDDDWIADFYFQFHISHSWLCDRILRGIRPNTIVGIFWFSRHV